MRSKSGYIVYFTMANLSGNGGEASVILIDSYCLIGLLDDSVSVIITVGGDCFFKVCSLAVFLVF